MRWLCVFDPVSLDQLRALCVVVEEGSFSAAARTFSQALAAPQMPMMAMPIQPQPSGTTLKAT